MADQNLVPATIADGKVVCACPPDAEIEDEDWPPLCYNCWRQAREDELDAGIVAGPATEATERRRDVGAYSARPRR
ncbi:MAG: hypothetical protein F4Y94_08645 [Chloroflexi bacterium]|nr:hypothetical protein [Chloroflexota bacterium]